MILLIFRKFFLPGPLVWGDAPYFYPEGLKELVSLPMIWMSRGNALGGVNLFLWIYPLMVLYGTLGTFLHLNNDIIIRLLFYLPSLIFGFSGMYLLTKYLKFSTTVQFFGTFIYLINTYYLLLVDGGQVGVVLAYGFFPLVLYFLLKVIDEASIKNFVFALIASFVLTVIDFRIIAICFLTAFLWCLGKYRKLWILFILSICLFCLSLYWIIPILKFSFSALSLEGVSGLQLTSLLNSLTLFSPNWPANEFGKIIAPYFYFTIVPILIFLPVFISKEKRVIWLTVLFLFFAFLAKGESAPFGFFYKFLISTKVGSVFRDSTKFFIPLVLIGGILIGKTVESLKNKIFYVLIFSYLVLLVTPAILGKLNGVLGGNIELSSYQKVYDLILNEDGFSRSAWFTERSPFTFHTEVKQALDARDLVKFRPLASMNVGTGDRFNFMNDNQYLDWFKLLGIKYLVFSGNPRVSILDKSDSDDWNRLLNLISKNDRLEKLNIGTSFPVYKNSNILPHEFFVDKTFLVVGGEDIYQKLQSMDKNFSVQDQGFLFLEDGKFDPSRLLNISSNSAVLIFNNETEKDLTMSFLQKDFVSIDNFVSSQWATRKSGDYLNWKYELLTKGIDTKMFDYRKGIAFSTQKNEVMQYKLDVPKDGSYYLEIRSMGEDSSSRMNVILDSNYNDPLSVNFQGENDFRWYEKGPIHLTKGSHYVVFENGEGTEVLNTFGLVLADDMESAKQLGQKFLGYFEHIDISDQSVQTKIKQILMNDKWENFVNGNVIKPGWIIYTDSFNENWDLQNANKDNFSYPMYSMINGFYVSPEFGNVKIIFKSDYYIRLGIYLSFFSAIIISGIVLWKLHKKR